MRGYVGSGNLLNLIAPADGVISGQGYLLDALFVIAAFTAAEGQPFLGVIAGVYQVAKPTDEAWTQGARIYWDADAEVFTTTASGNTEVGVATEARAASATPGLLRLNAVPAPAASGNGGGGGATAWDAGETYALGDLVIDRGGTWQATGASTNSQPISGNTDWTLVAGTPYVDVTFDPVALTTAPFFAATVETSPRAILVPAPGAGLSLNPRGFVLTSSPGDFWTMTDAFGNVAPLDLAVGLGVDQAQIFVIYTADVIGTDLVPINSGFGAAFPAGPYLTDLLNGGPVTVFVPVAANITLYPGDNRPITARTVSVLTGGTQSLQIRSYYDIIPSTGNTFATFFTITAVNQGTKTFTVTDAGAALNGATGTFAVVGSTGNDSTYTIVSAISGAGSTVIIVVEAIPDATADGWIEVT